MATKSRFKALVHYIVERCDDPKTLGATKLNKVLWYADSFAYRMSGATISGETAYVKRQFGPVPKKILETIRALQSEGKIIVRATDYFGKPKREFIAMKPADKDLFTDEERDVIDGVLGIICNHFTAASISDLSHDLIWEAAEMGEDIPIYAVLAAQVGAVTKADMKWADALIKQHSKALAA